MIAIGGGTAEFHLILGKAYLNRDEIPEATSELEKAAALNRNLPFIHMNLGVAYMLAGADERAETEFRRDIALEPDLADNYDQLGALYTRLGKDEDAETSFREALRRGSQKGRAHAGVGKDFQKKQKVDKGV